MLRVSDGEKFFEVFEEALRKGQKILNQHYYSSWFKNLWETGADQYEFYDLADEIYQKIAGEPLSHTRWDKAWQYRNILSPMYKQAKAEFLNAIIGWY